MVFVGDRERGVGRGLREPGISFEQFLGKAKDVDFRLQERVDGGLIDSEKGVERPDLLGNFNDLGEMLYGALHGSLRFGREEHRLLDSEGEIVLPNSALEIYTGRYGGGEGFTHRSTRLYALNYNYNSREKRISRPFFDAGKEGQRFQLRLLNTWVGDENGDPSEVVPYLSARAEGMESLLREIEGNFMAMGDVRDRALVRGERTLDFIKNFPWSRYLIDLQSVGGVVGRDGSHVIPLVRLRVDELVGGGKKGGLWSLEDRERPELIAEIEEEELGPLGHIDKLIDNARWFQDEREF